MKRVEVRLNLEAVAPLLDVIKDAVDDLGVKLAVAPQLPANEEELASEWSHELLSSQRSDVAVLLSLFGSEFFATGVVPLESTNSEPVLRACSAVRLRLREKHLKELGDEALETGEVNLSELSETQQKAFAAYVFLATLQELVVQHLDPTVME
ncbi:hypothetical protein [Oleiharenicola lentus]|uniref:hypothetical protein n=1 Tax=Oleiharenicola lentus TaxID=2508720 RepID=UPI003F66A608